MFWDEFIARCSYLVYEELAMKPGPFGLSLDSRGEAILCCSIEPERKLRESDFLIQFALLGEHELLLYTRKHSILTVGWDELNRL